MTTWYYYNKNGEKVGPRTSADIKTLASRGDITSETIIEIENDNGISATAARNVITFQPMSSSSGFFDIGFTRFITNTWTSILWVLSIILAFLGCVGAMVLGASNEAPELFIFAPIAAALFLLFMRMSFELTIVLFRIETHLRTIRDKYENK